MIYLRVVAVVKNVAKVVAPCNSFTPSFLFFFLSLFLHKQRYLMLWLLIWTNKVMYIYVDVVSELFLHTCFICHSFPSSLLASLLYLPDYLHPCFIDTHLIVWTFTWFLMCARSTDPILEFPLISLWSLTIKSIISQLNGSPCKIWMLSYDDTVIHM